MLDKMKQPRAVEKMLIEAVPEAKNTRWGTALVDTDDDPKLVRLTLNRAVSGMARKLVKTLKGTGITKVMLVLEDGSEIESFAEADEDEAAAASPAATATAPPAAPAGAPPPRAAGPDRAVLEKRLAALVPRIKGTAVESEALEQELVKLAAQAGLMLKTNNLSAASTGIDELARRLDAIPESAGAAAPDAAAPRPAAPGGDGAVVRVAKGLLLWNSTRGYVDQQLKMLQSAILEQSQDEADFDEIKANIGAIDVILERLDDRLSEKLDQLRGTKDSAAKAKIAEEARQLVTEYQSYVAKDELMADIDDNGFIPLDVKTKVAAALDAVLKTI